MLGKVGSLLAVLGVLVTGPAWAQQTALSSASGGSASGEGAPAKIKCHDEPNVSVTVDAEQAIPLKVVATLNCNEELTILSDPQAYTVKVRTAGGKVGYVTRYEVAIDLSTKAPAATTAAAASAAMDPNRVKQSSGEAALMTEEKGPHKPRVYVSDTGSWTDSGGFGNSSSVANGNLYGGYNPELVDIYQDFTSDCPAVVVTQEKSNADYAVLFDKGSSKKGLTGLGGLVKVNKVTVLSRSGDTVLSQTSHSEDTVVKVACTAISQRSGAGSADPINNPTNK